MAKTAALVKDLNVSGRGNPRSFTLFNGEIYFFADNSTGTSELWKTDGTQIGTQLIKDIGASSTTVSVLGMPSELKASASYLYFIADDGTGTDSIWRSDGTTSGTNKTALTGDLSSVPYLSTINNRAIVNLAFGIVKWTDGPSEGTLDSLDGFNIQNAKTSSYILWSSGHITDGTNAGTIDIGRAGDGAAIGNSIIFYSTPLEIWKTDGTLAGTTQIKTFPTSLSGNPLQTQIASLGGYAYFQAPSQNNKAGLWRTDGTVTGTVLIKELGNYIDTGDAKINIRMIAQAENVIYFVGHEDGTYKLYRSNGTESGTESIFSIGQATSPTLLGIKNDAIYLNDGINGIIYVANASANAQVLTGISSLNPWGIALPNNQLLYQDLSSGELFVTSDISAPSASSSGSSSSSPTTATQSIPQVALPSNESPIENPTTSATTPIDQTPNSESPVLGIKPQETVTTVQLATPILVGNLQFAQAVVGTPLSDVITGSDQGEVLAGGGGKNQMTGGGGPDAFLFETPGKFGKKNADVVTDFGPGEGDVLAVSQEAFSGLSRVRFTSVLGKRQAQQAGSTNKNFVYDERNGMLYYDGNGKKNGWGDGGEFVKLLGSPEIGKTDIAIV